MIADAMTGAVIRDVGQRYLSFGDSPSDVQLPQPVADHKYLLYLHIPFCVVLCPFCTFHRVEFKREHTERYFHALRQEIRMATDAGYRFSELYVGGGTPTVMPDELIETLHLVRDLHGAIRISVETNPDDLDDDQVPLMVEAGVNRLSVGVQSFDDQLLREMLRYDKYGSGAKIRERLERVHGTFDTVNVDMIFNFPHQTEEILERDLEILCDELRADQVSYYPLMTAPTARKSMLRNLGSVDYRREKRLYRIIARHLQNGGFSRSSAWCFSRSDGMIDEYITGQDDYLGLGSGAFSYLDGNIYASTFSINHYLHLVEQGQTGIIRQRAINRSDQMRYFLMMRLFGGSLDLDEAEHKFGGGFRRGLRLELAGLRLMGAVRMHGSRIELTDSGYYLWVTIMREFFTGVNNLRDEMRHSISAEAGMLPGAGAESREPDSLR